MVEAEDTRFGEIAVGRGFITRPQFEDGLKALEFVRQAGLTRSLGEILVEKGLMTEIQAQIVERAAASDEARIIAGFELIEKLGEGGMGAVYKARQISMDRLVALKTLAPQLAENREFTARFVREARTAAMLDHVNIVRGLDVGSEGDVYYFAMEFVEGESVGGIIERQGPIPEERALRIVIQVARALEYAWKTKQIIHRDIKPDNILVMRDDIAKVADLGLARTTDTESTLMTRTGVAMGSPHYISPEQARGEKDVDIRTDIYSLGATLYHMLVGAEPFTGSSAMAVITKHLTEPPVPVHVVKPEVSEAMSAIVAKMMEKAAAGRYADPTQLLDDLELVADGKEPRHAVAAGEPAPPPSPTGTAGIPGSAPAAADAGRKLLPFAAVGAGVTLLALIFAVVLALRGDGDRENEEKARLELEEIERLLRTDELQAAQERAKAAMELIAATKHVDKLRALMQEVEAKQERETETAEAAKREALLRQARDQIAAVRGLVAGKMFAESRTKFEGAKPAIEAAGLGDELDALAAEIAKAEADHADALVAEAAAHEKLREWRDAEAKYGAALRHLSGKRRDDVRTLLDGLYERMKLEDIIASAERYAGERRWRSVWDTVGKARRSGVKDGRLDRLAESAAAALAPPESLACPLGIELVLVRGGSFTMGRTDGEPDERPAHKVSVSSFYIGRFEVTKVQFEAFKKGLKTLSAGSEEGLKPASSVSWQSAVDFCKYLTNTDPKGATYRLPTEAEWEYAARGREGRAYPWGNEAPTARHANVLVGGKGQDVPSRVGSYPAGDTPSGISDMAGNVFEWCADWHGPYPSSDQVDPVGPAGGTKRVARGGAYGLDAAMARASLRGTRPPDKPLPVIGFRVVRELTDEQRAFERLVGK